ncbi:MAG: hypothetical protein K5657_04800 [Desulfovibrio sp.]|nr:hypothetical protein [Desulfovibrio sp.]
MWRLTRVLHSLFGIHSRCTLFFLSVLLIFPLSTAVIRVAHAKSSSSSVRTVLDEGLTLQEFPFMGREKGLIIVRIDPSLYHFELVQARFEDKQLRTVKEWAGIKGLDAAINASMFQKDGLTSTGYMRGEKKINNPKMHRRFGAFFVAQPRKSRENENRALPYADILERDTPKLNDLLGRYGIVIQNFRLISAERKNCWSPAGPRFTVACVGKDGTGAILFIFGTLPSTPYEVAETLLRLPLDIRTTMYVEGGLEAELFVKAGGEASERFLSFLRFFAGVPNILGAKKRTRLNTD